MRLPTLDAVRDAGEATAQKVKRHGRVLIPWLPTPPDCPDPECGEMMYAQDSYCPRQVRYVPSWECRECGTITYRDPFIEYETPQPRRGAPRIREALR